MPGLRSGHHVPSQGSPVQFHCIPGTYQPSLRPVDVLGCPTRITLPRMHLCLLRLLGGDISAPSGQTACMLSDAGITSIKSALIARRHAPGSHNPFEGSISSLPVSRQILETMHPNCFGSLTRSQGTWQNQSGAVTCNDADPGYFVQYQSSTAQDPVVPGPTSPAPVRPHAWLRTPVTMRKVRLPLPRFSACPVPSRASRAQTSASRRMSDSMSTKPLRRLLGAPRATPRPRRAPPAC